MDFRPIEVIKKGVFGETYFRDIYSNVNDKWYNNSFKELEELKNIDQKYYCSNYYDATVNKGFGYGLVLLILKVGFSGILDIH